MVTVPPPLAWLSSFSKSLSGALGCSVSISIEKTVNPLVHKVRLRFGEQVPGKNALLVWNLFQKYAAANDCMPQGKMVVSPKELTVQVGMKQRTGFPKNEHPAA